MSKFFLYNGVELPALPEWDKTVYPYAFIYIVTLDGTTGVYTLVVSSSSVMSYDGNGIICPSATVGQRYTVSEDSWAAAAASDDFYIKRDNLIYTVWANFDVLNSDGSVYVAASEPVPVAGKFPLREWVGWLIAGLCSRAVPVVETREPVAYLYNGVRLPPPPKWNEDQYPTAFIIISFYSDGTPGLASFYISNETYLPVTSLGSSDTMWLDSPETGERMRAWVNFNREFKWSEFDRSNSASLIYDESLPNPKTSIWANRSLTFYDGYTVEAYNPIPVYE